MPQISFVVKRNVSWHLFSLFSLLKYIFFFIKFSRKWVSCYVVSVFWHGICTWYCLDSSTINIIKKNVLLVCRHTFYIRMKPKIFFIFFTFFCIWLSRHIFTLTQFILVLNILFEGSKVKMISMYEKKTVRKQTLKFKSNSHYTLMNRWVMCYFS